MADEAPPGWTRGTVADIAAPKPGSIAIGPFGSALKAELYVSSGVRVLRGQDLNDGRAIVVSDPVFVSEGVAIELKRSIVREGDLVFPHRGAIGRVGLVEDGEYLLSSSMMKLSVDRTRHDPAFFFYFFRGPGRDELLQRASTVGTPGIGQPLASLRGIPVVYPDLSEQRAIAEVLGALDDKIAANTCLATTADALARMDFARALGLPGVEEIAVGQCATTVLGGTPSRDELSYWTDGTVGWLNSGKANEARILQPSEWITEEALSKSAAKVMPQRATVVAITGATLGQVARLEITASGNQSLIGIWSDDPAMNDWIYFAIQHEIPQLLRAATGAAQQHVNKRDLDALVLPALGGADLAAWGERVRPLLDLAAARERENLTLAATRDALLPALMSSKLHVRDALDAVKETAS